MNQPIGSTIKFTIGGEKSMKPISIKEKIEETIVDIPLASVEQVFEEKGVLFRFRKGWLNLVSKKLAELFSKVIEEIINNEEPLLTGSVWTHKYDYISRKSILSKLKAYLKGKK